MADVTSPFGFPSPEDDDFVRDGAQDIENLATGVNDYLTGGFLYAGTRYFFSNGSFAKADPLLTGDIGLRAVKVTVIGGGGGGGSTTSTFRGAASGGSGGGMAQSFITDMSLLSASETVTRGSGGAGGAAGAAGTGGATSSFGTLVVASGGGGGPEAGGAADIATAGLNGGIGTTGDLLVAGSIAHSGLLDAISATGGGGGGTFMGGGGIGGRTGSQSNGAAGRSHGGGGAGGASQTGGVGFGGAGANGIVIVDCFV